MRLVPVALILEPLQRAAHIVVSGDRGQRHCGSVLPMRPLGVIAVCWGGLSLSVVSEGSVPASVDAVYRDKPSSAGGTDCRSRGWLMRRLLLGADLAGLLVAFMLAQALVPAQGGADTVESSWELALFIASLPLWGPLRIPGLYDRDEERSDHSTVDDIFGVFQVVTIGTWGPSSRSTHLAGLAAPDVAAARHLLADCGHAPRPSPPSGHPRRRATAPGLRPERDHRRVGRRGAARRQQNSPTSRIPARRGRLRRQQPRTDPPTAPVISSCLARPAIFPSSCAPTLRTAS